MDETILYPSPNWFQASGLVVTRDNWLIYGGPSKTLCVLEPVPEDQKQVVHGSQQHTAHVVARAHTEKITCLDVCPEWPEKKAVLTGSQDGTVKQWLMERTERSLTIRSTHVHEYHAHDKEEVVGVGYCNNGYAISVGSHGLIVKWDLNSNVVKSIPKVLKGFKPTCMACSPHMNLNVAIGTKQGVVFGLDLNGQARVIYKVRGQDDEVTKVSWCPQYEVAIRKLLKESTKESAKSAASQRMEKIRQEPEHPDVLKALDKRVEESITEEKPILVNDKLEPVTAEKETEPNGTVPNENASKQDETISTENPISAENASETNGESPNEEVKAKEETKADESGLGKTLPEDSFDETVVQEDDMFDIYKDHEADEFGHKKYEPEDVIVQIPEEAKPVDYLTECQKLKDDILKRKNEQSIDALVDAMDKTHVDAQNKNADGPSTSEAANGHLSAPQGKITKGEVESSVHIHKHLLATIGRHGSLRVWSKAGKLVGSCLVPSSNPKNQRNQNQRGPPTWTTLLWYQPEVLLVGDGKSQLLECNPLKIDCKNKLEYRVIHTLHKRGLFSISSNCPRVQPPDMSSDKSRDSWLVWTAAQDRNLICYSMKQRTVISEHQTCGGYLYTVRPCPYDSKRIAMSVGDGAVRVWETDTTEDDDTKLTLGTVNSYWNNVQGKILTVAWHPTKENILAFGTAEARVGLIDMGTSKTEKPAKTLQPFLSNGVYSLSWGDSNDLYACSSAGDFVKYNCDKMEAAPTPITVTHEGQKWELTFAQWHPQGLICGSNIGGVALVNNKPPYDVVAAVFIFSKMIHNVDWHPQETSNSEGESPYKNMLAVCSLDKSHNIVVLELSDKDEGKQLTTWKTLSGHTLPVLEVAWNPHMDGYLLSSSQDTTVRVWSIAEGACVSIFGRHSVTALSAVWSPLPQLPTTVMSGGGDCALRLWDYTAHPVDKYEEKMHEVAIKRDKKKLKKEEKSKEAADGEKADTEDYSALLEAKLKANKKFLLPLTTKQINPCKIEAVRYIFSLYCMQYGNSQPEMPESLFGLDYIKMFGTTKELTELLDDEAERLQDMGNIEAWCMLNIVRGYMDVVFSYAHEKDLLDSFLLSIAPCVSFKYWKDVTMLYLAQIDRMMAKGQQAKLFELKTYGGPIYRKVGTLLSLHDVNGAVKVLVEAQLFKEAYILCRARYVEDLAKDTLQQWAYFNENNGLYNMSAICYIALGDVFKAANVLGKSSDEQSLYMAGTMAKLMGQTAFSQHCFEKGKALVKPAPELESSESSETLTPLPSRAELLLNGQKDTETTENKDTENTVNKDTENTGNKHTENTGNKHTENTGNKDTVELETDVNKIATETCRESNLQTIENGSSNDEKVNSEKDIIDESPEEANSESKILNTPRVDDEKLADCKEDKMIVSENNESVKEASDKDKIGEILEELPIKMEGLAVEPIDEQVENKTVSINGSGDDEINCTQDVVK